MNAEFFEELAMWKFSQEYPEEIRYLDLLLDKIELGTITDQERSELEAMDRAYIPEIDRYVLHYRVNWPFMELQTQLGYITNVSKYKTRCKKLPLGAK